MRKFCRGKGFLVTTTALATIAFGGFSSAAAQDSVAAQDGAKSKDNVIVVTAQKRSENVQDVPISMAAYSGENLQELGVKQSRELAGITPNLQWKGDGGMLGNTIFIRGVGTNKSGGEAVSAVGVYLDEVNINNSNALGLFLYDIERVEVLRGPQGTLYGRNSTGGAINNYSRKPELGGGLTGNFTAGYGNFDAMNLEAGLGFDLGDKAAVRISGMYRKSDGDIRNSFLGTDGRSLDAFALRGQILVEPTDGMEILASVQYGEVDNRQVLFNSQGLFDPPTGAPCATPTQLGTCGDFFGYVEDPDFHRAQSEFVPVESADTFMATGRLNWDLGGVTFTSITSYFEYKDGDGISQDVDASPLDILTVTFGTRSDQISQELRLSSNSGGPLNWVVGGYYFTEDLVAGTNITTRGFGPGFVSSLFMVPSAVPEAAHVDFSQETETFALFGQATYEITDQLSLTGGFRWTWEDKSTVNNSYVFDITTFPSGGIPAFGDYTGLAVLPLVTNVSDSTSTSEPSWRIALDYAATDDVLLYASVARNFKAGIGNSQATFDPAEAQIVNPEFITAYEVGIKSEPTHWLRLNAAAFYYDFTDQQVSTFNFGTELLTNAGESTLYGAEFDIVARPNENWLFSLGMGLLDAKFDVFDAGDLGDLSGNELPAAPGVNANGLVRYTHPVDSGELSAQIDFTYTGHQFFSNVNDPLLAQDSYWLFNARAGYKFMDDRFEIAGWVKNIGNKDYFIEGFDNAGFTGSNLIIVGKPRTYGIELTASF